MSNLPEDDQPQAPQGGDPSNEKPSHGKRNIWIVLAGVLALVAIGLGIWAFSVKSDLDDAQDTVDQQNEQIAAAEQKGTEAVAGAKTAYDDVRAELEGTQQQNDELKQDLEKSASELDSTTEAVADAQGEAEKANAQVKEAEASAETAKSCARSAIDAFGQVFEAPSLEEGVDAAVAELEQLKPSCSGVLGG